MKEKIIGLEQALMKKGRLGMSDLLFKLSSQQFELKQEIKTFGNKIYRLKKDKLTLEQKVARIEKEKDSLFVKLGLKFVKPLEKEEDKNGI